jgi:hypothetical protein
MVIRIGRPKEPVALAEIKEFEHAFGRDLPEDYTGFLLRHNGATPETNIFPVGSDNESGVNAFIPLGHVLAERALLKNEISVSCIPIAWAEGGNYVLLDLADQSVILWDHEEPQSLKRLAGSVSQFLDVLKPFDVSQIELKPGQVKSVWIDPELLKKKEGP